MQINCSVRQASPCRPASHGAISAESVRSSLVAFTVRGISAGLVPGVRALAGSAGMRSTWKVHQGPAAGAWGLLCRVVCLSSPGAREDLAGQSPSSVFVPVNPVTDVLLPAVSGSCTGLYVAVRGVGCGGASAYVHIADSVPAVSCVKCRFRRSVGHVEVQEEAYFKPSAQPTLVRTQHLPHIPAGQSR